MREPDDWTMAERVRCFERTASGGKTCYEVRSMPPCEDCRDRLPAPPESAKG